MSTKVVLLDPERAIPERVTAALGRAFELELAPDAASIRGAQFELALVAPQRDSFEACRALVASASVRDVIILGREPLLRDAIAAIRAQAADFVPNSRDPEAIIAAARSVTERRKLKDVLERLRQPPSDPPALPELIGESPAMQHLRERLTKIMSSDVTVLVTGESGTGKEVVARALHTHGLRSAGRFVAVSCGAIPRSLIESEFFGWVRGAFTDAKHDHAGLLAHASGGTLFLDEIGDMPLELQPKLLRALQERAARPLGAREEKPFDARVIAASTRDLEHEVATGRLRQDLYFRLNVLRVRLPPLRERDEDVLRLAQHFIESASSKTRPVVGLTPAAARALLDYEWPGNVRELEHCILAAMAVARYDHITAGDLVESVRRHGIPAEEPAAGNQSLEDVEREHILRVVDSVSGNKALAAKLLGLDRKTLYRRLREYEKTSLLSAQRRDQSA